MPTNRSLIVGMIMLLLAKLCNSDCRMFLAKSTLHDAGRGIFLGKHHIKPNETILNAQVLLIPMVYSNRTQLLNYVFTTSDPRYDYLPLNYVTMTNHNSHVNSDPVWDEQMGAYDSQLYRPDIGVESLLLEADEPIESGDEIFLSYGPTWFHGRYGGPVADVTTENTEKSTRRDQSVLETNGVCISDTYVGRSHFPNGRAGLFTRRAFQKGEVVSVDPVLTLPTATIRDTFALSPMVNYCISKPGSAIALLPLGLASMANHGSGNRANIFMDWFTWPRDSDANDGLGGREELGRVLNLSVSELLQGSSCQLDIKLVAKRDLVAGEELMLDYGVDWLEQWALYLSSTLAVVGGGKDIEIDTDGNAVERKNQQQSRPTFRHFIEAPDGMFPLHWFNT